MVDKLADHMNQIDKSPYAYSWNNPTNLTDPDGNCPICRFIIPILEALTVRQIVTTAVVVTAGAVVVSNRDKFAGKDFFVRRDGTRNNVPLNPMMVNSNNKTDESGDTKSDPTDRELPRDRSGLPVRDPEAQDAGPHSQIGKRAGRNGDYKQVREFDKDGNPVKDIDFTDHGRPSTHPHNPHEHVYKPSKTGGTLQRDKTPAPLTYTDWINGLNK